MSQMDPLTALSANLELEQNSTTVNTAGKNYNKMIILPFEVWQQKKDAENIAKAITIPFKNVQRVEPLRKSKEPDEEHPFRGINLTYLADFTNYCIRKEPLFPDVERGSLEGLVSAIREIHLSVRREKVRNYYHTPKGNAILKAAHKRYLLKHPEQKKKAWAKFSQKWKEKLGPDGYKEYNRRKSREYNEKYRDRINARTRARGREKKEMLILHSIIVSGFKLYD